MFAAAPTRHLLDATVRFARVLREAGILVTPSEAIDAARSLDCVDVGDRTEVFLALGSVFVSRPEDLALFADLFERFWAAAEPEAAAPAEADPRRDLQPPVPALGNPRQTASLQQWMRPGAPVDEEPVGMPLMGSDERLAEKDFTRLAAAELDEITRVARRMARRLVTRPSRRWEPARRGERIHPRRTLRRSFRTGGEAVTLAYRRRKRRKAKLVVICDVSGSMDLYSRFLLQFLYALQNVFARVETFVFSTRIRRITEELAGDTYQSALRQLTRSVREWSGGTRIGESLEAFADTWGDRLDRRTIVVILSDGWDTGDPAQLDEAMARIHRAAGKTIWLNPLAGSPDYQPLTRGMQAALPHVDHFAPAHNLASLQALVRHLVL
jgi:uncharacterized protein